MTTQALHRLAGKVWYRWPEGGCDERYRLTATSRPGLEPYDVAIVGAGVVGCALAYELSRYRLRVILIEKKFDVGEGTSKANSAIIHTGFDAEPGTLESELVSAASRQWPEVAERLKVPMMPVGALVIAVDDEQLVQLLEIQRKALENGVEDVEYLDASRVPELEPYANPRALGGLLVHRESIIDPFSVCVAFAETALANGVDILFGAGARRFGDRRELVKSIYCDGDIHVRTRFVVNVAGLWSREVADLYGGEEFEITPRRGQFLLYDKCARRIVNRILLPIPTARTKGSLVAPTIFGNVLAGPTAEDLRPGAVSATETTAAGRDEVAAGAARLCPDLIGQPVIAAYAGLRCHCAQGNYRISFNDGQPGFVTVTGIRSTGLSASFILARHLRQGLVDRCGLSAIENPQAVDGRPDSCWPGWWRRPFDDPERLAHQPDYGRVVCSCEQISHAEIEDALVSPLRPQTLDALKRRTRVLTGPCQGFHCRVPVAERIRNVCGMPLEAVTKLGPGSELVAPPATEES
jgi:glycerol-3-phosphate dehydrogenase